METATKRYAFISYNHKDQEMAKWLQAKLESYKLPTEIHNEFEDSRYLRPVFRDKTDLNAGILSEELKKHLISSKYLVVVCSPNSAKSKWVNDEVMEFLKMGRAKRIIPFIVDGTPHGGEDECLPQALRELEDKKELLGISIPEVGRQKAFIKLVSKMLDIDYDVLWQRHKRQVRNRRIATAVTLSILLALFYYLAVPLSIHLTIKDEEHHLPMPESAIVTVRGTEYQLSKIDTTLVVDNIPGYFRGRNIDVFFNSTYYKSQETVCRMGLGISDSQELKVQRDSTFSIYGGVVYNEEGVPVSGAVVDLEGLTTTTDSNGKFRIEVPIEKQTETKRIKISKQGMATITRNDECPDSELKYIIK
ncbi:MAG: TIR domain-containing protein [Prevotella sp.]